MIPTCEQRHQRFVWLVTAWATVYYSRLASDMMIGAEKAARQTLEMVARAQSIPEEWIPSDCTPASSAREFVEHYHDGKVPPWADLATR